ncbi:MAG: isoaspartyl peptidase/L-asparaginase, partial [Candidatus Bathyarchaeota archaeon]|nr:isoaspartyl peptidase/L-asparaginase [Candidatus Bathyarchaeota archaeon]
YMEYARNQRLHEWYRRLSDEQQGTTNVIGMDAERNICVGVSTSGTSLKFPGRLGDTPIIGAGNYCDNRRGGAACTGRGELTIRLLTARMIVKHMEDGLGLQNAVSKGLGEIHDLNEFGTIQCIAVDREGNAVSGSTGGESTYWYMDVDMAEPEERPGIWVKS